MSSELVQYLIPDTDKVFYVPDFISVEEEELLIRKINESPLPKWKQLADRRLQIWGGSVTARKVLIPEEMPAFVNKFPDIPGHLRDVGAFRASPHGAPNHIIMNEYLPGQGIMPHEDGPAYHPVVATISLGSHAVFHYYRYKPTGEQQFDSVRPVDPDPVLSMLLERRSLVITTSSLYTSHLHGIDGITEDIFSPPSEDGLQPHSTLRIANVDSLTGAAERETVLNGGRLQRGVRYSLTCRDVEKVAGVIPIVRR